MHPVSMPPDFFGKELTVYSLTEMKPKMIIEINCEDEFNKANRKLTFLIKTKLILIKSPIEK